MNRPRLIIVALTLLMWLSGGAFVWAASYDIDAEGMTPDTDGVITGAEATDNTAALMASIAAGHLDLYGSGDYWITPPPLAPAYRLNATTYAVGDRYRADTNGIYQVVSVTTGITATGIGPSGTGDGQTDGGVVVDYIAAVGTWDKRRGLRLTGPNSPQRTAQGTNEYLYSQADNLRFRFDGRAIGDWCMQFHQDQATGWDAGATYAIGAVVSSSGNIYVADTGGIGGTLPTGTAANTSFGGTSRWDYICQTSYLTNITLRNMIFSVEDYSNGLQFGSKAGLSGNTITGRQLTVENCVVNAYFSHPEYVDVTTFKAMRNASTKALVLSLAPYNVGVEWNYCYGVRSSGGRQGFYNAEKFYVCDAPQQDIEVFHSGIGTWIGGSASYSPVPGRHKIAFEDCPGIGVYAESGAIELYGENGYPLIAKMGRTVLPATVDWEIAVASGTIDFDADNASTYLYPGMAVEILMADGTPRTLIIRTVGTDATFLAAGNVYEGVQQPSYCYFGTNVEWDDDTTAEAGDDIVKTDATMYLIDGLHFVLVGDRAALIGPSKVELNSIDFTPLATLPIGVVALNAERTVVGELFNGRGVMTASNDVRIAAHCAGTSSFMAGAEFASRYFTPTHPLAFTRLGAAPRSGINHLRPITAADTWGVGPEACFADAGESLVPFKMISGRYSVRLDGHAAGRHIPIYIPTTTDRVRYRAEIVADANDTELNVSVGNWEGSESDTRELTLDAGVQTITGTIKFDEALLTPLSGRNYFHLDNAPANLLRIEVESVPLP